MEYLGLCISFAEMESSKLINYSINMCWIGWDILSLFFVFGEILSNFDPRNIISTYIKDFLWKKMAQICQISGKFLLHHQIFMISSSRVERGGGGLHFWSHTYGGTNKCNLITFAICQFWICLKKGARLCHCFVSKKLIKYVYVNKIIINPFF
jgi:hypothetical protein